MSEINSNPEVHPMYGRLLDVTLPSGAKYQIREQNGGDDDILSRMGKAKTGESLNEFIAAIVMKDYKTGQRISPAKVAEWRINDKYAMLLKSRIHSMGAHLEFKYEWTEGFSQEYEEDLSQYDWDFAIPYPAPGSEELAKKNKYVMFPYKDGEKRVYELTLSSGKKVKYRVMMSTAESYFLAKDQDDLSKNDELKVRELSLHIEGKYRKIEDFSVFSVRDMMEIRKHVKDHDTTWEPLTQVVNPQNKNQKVFLNVILQESFFYPQLT